MVARASSTDVEPFEPTQALETRLSDAEWRDLSGLIRSHAGIKLSEAKRVFLVSRLLKRLRATGTQTFREYYELVAHAGVGSEEHQQLINAVTTNKTEFFRERDHFDVLVRWLRSRVPEVQSCRSKGLNIWCAAASTGEEPYTLAAVLREALDDYEWSCTSICASDIDTAVLARARRAVYAESALETVDRTWRARMFVRGRGDYRDKFRVRRELRERVKFFQLNLMQEGWPHHGPFDAIFCRNVLIYFERAAQEQVVRRLLQRLAPHGLLFLGHAECLNGFSVGTQLVAHSVYAHFGTYLPARIRGSRLESAWTSVNTPAHSAVSGRSAATMADGQSGPDVSDWVGLRLERGFLLLLHAAGSSAVRYSDEPTTGVEFRDAVVRQVSELLETLSPRIGCADTIQCKLIIGPHDSKGAPADLTNLSHELSSCGVELVALRQLELATELRIQASSGRIQILHASSARNSQSAPVARPGR